MELSTQPLAASRGRYRLYAEALAGPGTPVVLMHGFPDNVHLYDRVLPYLAGKRPVVRFDFLGWAGRTSRAATRTRPGTRSATSTPSSA